MNNNDLYKLTNSLPSDVQSVNNHNVSFMRQFFSTFFARKSAVFGLFFSIIIISLAFIIPAVTGPAVISGDPELLNLSPSKEHIFGTDSSGRDMWARTWYALRYSLILGMATTGINILIAIFLGLSMGYYQKFDKGMQFFIKVFYSIPGILILILLTLIPAPKGSSIEETENFRLMIMIVGLVVTGWVSPSQQVRSATLQQRNQGFVTASKTLGTSNLVIIKDLFKFTIPTIISQVIIVFPRMILSEATIGFLGLGIPNADTLGNLISEGRKFITVYPYQVFIPVGFLITTVISIQLVGDGLQEASSKMGGR